MSLSFPYTDESQIYGELFFLEPYSIRGRITQIKQRAVTFGITSTPPYNLIHTSNDSNCLVDPSFVILSSTRFPLDLPSLSNCGTNLVYVNDHLVPKHTFRFLSAQAIIRIHVIVSNTIKVGYLPDIVCSYTQKPPFCYQDTPILSYASFAWMSSGSFGEVFRATYTPTKELRAIKRFHFINKGIQTEISLLRDLHHPNIISYIDSFTIYPECFLVTEYAPKGNLGSFKYEIQPAHFEFVISQIFANVLEALSYLHSRNIVHRDVKPENILITSNGSDMISVTAKLCDLGLATTVPAEHDAPLIDISGTPYYFSPEIVSLLLHKPLTTSASELHTSFCGYGTPVDVWALGVTLYWTFFDKSPFPDINVDIFYETVFNALVEVPTTSSIPISNEAVRFIHCLTSRIPSDRLSAKQALEHSWITNQHPITTICQNIPERDATSPLPL